MSAARLPVLLPNPSGRGITINGDIYVRTTDLSEWLTDVAEALDVDHEVSVDPRVLVRNLRDILRSVRCEPTSP